MSRESERWVVTLCSSFSIPTQRYFQAKGYPGHKQDNGNNGAGKKREEQRRSWVRERGETLWERLERGLCNGQCHSVSPPGTLQTCCPFSAIGCLSLHWTVMGLNCHSVQQLPHSDVSYIVAIELKGKGEPGLWDEGRSGEIVSVLQHSTCLCPAACIPALLWGSTILWLQAFIIHSSILWKALCKLLGLIQRWIRPVVHLRGVPICW